MMIPSFPYGRQVLFPILLSTCATCCLGYAVLDCNFVEITHDSFERNLRGVSVGFWQTMDELNNHRHGNNYYDEGRQCVHWTSEQTKTFDALWNYGRYSGALCFVVSVLVTLILTLTMWCQLSPCMEEFLGMTQLILSLASGMLVLAALQSTMCHEFDCWVDVGAILAMTASAIELFCGCMTLSLGFAPSRSWQKQHGMKTNAMLERPTEPTETFAEEEP
ncbi:expressed unknown protein [Seminavis robusta]|uniref:Uncharacterized protein n=1 Tax=Seminavis robusta TaxID=568900 RepID=A0A9N8HP18_9STRA|nr:expressed unknown protein [Seminavis robusta]|eukprot:Sro1046_g235030.1 n/a (220) ;mRNA; f:13541-14200